MTLAREITLKHGGRWLGAYGVMPTPGHGKRDQGTTLHDRSDGRGVIVNCFNADWREVRDALGIECDAREFTREERQSFARRRAKEQADRLAEQLRRAEQTWNGAEPPQPHGLVARYLEFRGMSAGPISAALAGGALREHPNVFGRPAMLALARDAAGRRRAVQATRLKRDGRGKAEIANARLTFGSLKGAAVRLTEPGGDVLAIAEGTETALAFSALHGVPAWATLGTANLVGFVPPVGIRMLIIAADADDAGLAAADELVSHVRSKVRCIMAAAPEGQDWADVLREAGA